jgi:hypothetical protein
MVVTLGVEMAQAGQAVVAVAVRGAETATAVALEGGVASDLGMARTVAVVAEAAAMAAMAAVQAAGGAGEAGGAVEKEAVEAAAATAAAEALEGGRASDLGMARTVVAVAEMREVAAAVVAGSREGEEDSEAVWVRA